MKLKFYFFLFLTFTLAATTMAQVPTVSSFTPTSGPVGTNVTITGTNFNSTLANNVVYFGAMKAIVTGATTTQLIATVPAGATYQPITVLNTATGLQAYSRSNFIATFTPAKGYITTSDFSSKVNFTSGTNPYSVAIGDLDGDGKADLVSANSGNNNISVFRNTSTAGAITTTSFNGNVDFSTGAGSTPYSVAIGDLDGDGKLDIAVANGTANTVSVFRNTSTSGVISSASFAARVDFTTGSDARSVVIGDLDGDGKPDLTVANSGGSGTVSIFRNTSTSGSITSSSFATKVELPTGFSPYSVAIGDLDGDGKADLTVANSGSGTVSVLRNTSTPGAISASSFAAKVDFITGSSPRSVAIGDLDGDGKQDLAVANSNSNAVSVFRNTGSSGSITSSSFAAKVDFTTGSFPISLSIGDLDGDGKADLAVANSNNNNVSILRNTSTSGAISTSSFATKVDFAMGSTLNSVAIGDLDGDGKADLAVGINIIGGGTVSVLRNSPVYPPSITSFSPASGPVGTTVTITGTNFSTTQANNVVFFGATQATVTSATSTQLVVTVPPGATYQPISVLAKERGLTAYSNTSFAITFGASGALNTAAFQSKVDFTTASAPFSVAMGDLNNDGRADLVAATNVSNRLSTFTNQSAVGRLATSSFSAKVDLTTGSGPTSLAVGDVDSDGLLDLVAANSNTGSISVFENTTSPGATFSSFSSKVDFTAGTNPQAVAIADLDADGKPELMVVNKGDNTLSVFKNASTTGTISTSSFSTKVDFPTGSSPSAVAVADLDGDGKPEIAVTNASGNTVSVFRNMGAVGNITSESFSAAVDFSTGANPQAISLGDLDGDGKSDLVVANKDDNTVSIIRNSITSAGAFTAASFAAKVDVITGTGPQAVALGDLDGDGKLDVAVANFTANAASLLRNISAVGALTASSFAVKVDVTTGAGPYSVTIGDVDNDGKPDLIIANSTDNTVSVLRNALITPLPTITSFAPATGQVGTSVTITGTNFNTTPANSIVYFGATKAAVTAATATQLTVTVPVGATYQPITVTNNGLVAYSSQPFLPTFPSGSTAFTANAFSAWEDFFLGYDPRSIAIGDLDGDGKADLAVASYRTNMVSVFRNISTSGAITASSFATSVDFPTGSGPNSVAICDLDGDGKLDLMVANSSANTVSIFRNTSSLGSITDSSFASKVDFITGANPSVAIADLDGDGKPDLTIANKNSNTVSIYRNTSILGSITSSSFAAKIDFATGTSPESIAIADLDGDGKPDLVTSNSTSDNLSVFRNTSTLGAINASSFSSKVDFGTIDTYFVAIGDLDGDGKPDLVATQRCCGAISIFRNNSTAGSITSASFASKVDFATGSSPYSVAIGDLDGDGKADLTVANNSSGTVSVLRNTSTSGAISASSFASKVDFTTGSSPISIAIGDLDGDGKPDLVVANGSTVSILRNALLSPITFVPTSGQVGATITIAGSGFSTTLTDQTVRFTAASGSTVVGTITAATATTLTVTLPAGVITGKVTVTKGLLTTSSSTEFLVLPFAITSFSPSIGSSGTPITITGTGFSSVAANNVVKFNGTAATVSGSTPTTIVAQVPAGATAGKITVTTAGETATSTSDFDGVLAITSFSPTSAAAGASLTIIGTGFSTDKTKQTVKFTAGTGTVDAVITSSSSTSISVTVPATAVTGKVSVARETSTVSSAIEFLMLPFAITSFSPSVGAAGTAITITGTGFSSVVANSVVNFNGTLATVVSSTPTTIVAEVPVGATTGAITVTTAGQTITSTAFTVINLKITGKNFNNAASTSQSITVNDISEVASIAFFSKGVSAKDPTFKSVSVALPTTNSIVYQIPAAEFTDPVGVRFYFSLKDKKDNEVKSEEGYVYKTYPSGVSTQIPNLVFGSDATSYQLISVPLELTSNTVGSVFKDLGSADKSKWRMYSYPGFTKEMSTSDNISVGNGYWLIAKNSTTINHGEGKTVAVKEDAPFVLKLVKGWNLIGNPYNFSISWDDVLVANGNPTGLGKLRFYKGGTFTGGDILGSYKGAFVRLDGVDKLDVKVPVVNKGLTGGRVGNAPQEETGMLSNPNWQVKLTFDDGFFSNDLAGFGMATSASENVDCWDELTLPTPEGINSFNLVMRQIGKESLIKDVVKTNDQYTWSGSIMSDRGVIISWDNTGFGLSDKLLMLETNDRVSLVDMRNEKTISLPAGRQLFKIHYGNASYVKEASQTTELVGGFVFPNPLLKSSGSIKLPVSLQQGINQVRFTLLDATGKVCATSTEGTFDENRQEIEWINDFSSLNSGVYLLKVEVNGSQSFNSFYRRLILMD